MDRERLNEMITEDKFPKDLFSLQLVDISKYFTDCEVIIDFYKYFNLHLPYIYRYILNEIVTNKIRVELTNTEKIYQMCKDGTVNIYDYPDECLMYYLESEYNITFMLYISNDFSSNEWINKKIYIVSWYNYEQLILQYPKDKIVICSEKISVLFNLGVTEIILNANNIQIVLDDEFINAFNQTCLEWLESLGIIIAQIETKKLINKLLKEYDYDLLFQFLKINFTQEIVLDSSNITEDLDTLANYAKNNNIRLLSRDQSIIDKYHDIIFTILE